MKFKKIVFNLENCDSIEFKPKDVIFFCVKGITNNIEYQTFLEPRQYKKCSYFSIFLKPNTNVNKKLIEERNIISIDIYSRWSLKPFLSCYVPYEGHDEQNQNECMQCDIDKYGSLKIVITNENE